MNTELRIKEENRKRHKCSWFFHPSSFILHPSPRKGFTIIELLVAIALFGMVVTLVFIAYNRVSSQIFVTNLAYELALSFRQAQSFGISVHEFSRDGTDTFNVGYGLHFDAESTGTYAFFADKGGESGDALFNGSFGVSYNASGCLSATECLNVFRLEKGNRLYKFCGVLPTGDGGPTAPDVDKNEECNTLSLPSSNPAITYLDITFLRPNPDATIKTNQSPFGRQYRAARIYVIAPSGEKRIVEVSNTGQISVN